MNDAATVCFGYSSTQLLCNLLRFCSGQWPAKKPVRERFTVKEFHGEKVERSVASGYRVNLEDFADARMGNFARVPYLRRQLAAKPGLAHLIAMRRPSFSSMAS